ncbi:MAG: hypothetical protein C4530_17700 [Desulfobacteraceae bacterium]|nr:MAG: hypothetical protein C4530_17700 [Desulfobacteraceae bacterium]
MKTGLLIFSSILFFIWGCAAHSLQEKENAVYLYLKKPDAESVFFLHSGDGYRFHAATRIDGRTWEVKVPSEGGFKYFYIVDGEPFVPDCRYQELDDFGSANCIYAPVL